MIEILFDHSYEDDYFVLSDVSVNIKDASEKERIVKLVKQHSLVGRMEFPGNDLKLEIADLLGIDVKLIDFDTNEIDLY